MNEIPLNLVFQSEIQRSTDLVFDVLVKCLFVSGIVFAMTALVLIVLCCREVVLKNKRRKNSGKHEPDDRFETGSICSEFRDQPEREHSTGFNLLSFRVFRVFRAWYSRFHQWDIQSLQPDQQPGPASDLVWPPHSIGRSEISNSPACPKRKRRGIPGNRTAL